VAGLLNPDLDLGALRQAFTETGRVKVPQVLRPDFAEAMHACLETDVPWQLSYHAPQTPGRDTFRRLSAREVEALGDDGLRDLVRRVEGRAAEGFQYLYEAYDVLRARRAGRDPDLRLQAFLSFLGTDELFDFVQDISGDTAFNRVDCHACRYRPGHFLREHADESPLERRHMAYVFYFTRDWHEDFGGVTFFKDDAGRITDSYVPDFNSLMLFKVPVLHSVSQVASFAPRPRLSITGWFTRED